MKGLILSLTLGLGNAACAVAGIYLDAPEWLVIINTLAASWNFIILGMESKRLWDTKHENHS